VTERLLTAREVASRERVSTETVLRWYRNGEFKGVAFKTPGGQIRWWEDRLNAWEEERAAAERGSVSHPAGRRPAGNLAPVSHPTSEED
jgi:predicted DNA-binding transcriptional regulator AlpA